MTLTKPPQVENDEFKSAKWDELTTVRRFSRSDAPTLLLLCQWRKIAQLARDELDAFGEQAAYSNDMGDLKAFPQIATLKTASLSVILASLDHRWPAFSLSAVTVVSLWPCGVRTRP